MGASQAPVSVWLLWESPGGDESGKCLWKSMGCVGHDLPLLHGDPTTSLTWLGLDFQNLGQVWLKGSRLTGHHHHRGHVQEWCPCRSVSNPRRILANPCIRLSLPSSVSACSECGALITPLDQDRGGSWLLKALLNAFMGHNLWHLP